MMYRPLNRITQTQASLLGWLHAGLGENVSNRGQKGYPRASSDQSTQLMDLIKKTCDVSSNLIQLLEKLHFAKMKSEERILAEQEKIHEALGRAASKLDVTYRALLLRKELHSQDAEEENGSVSRFI